MNCRAKHFLANMWAHAYFEGKRVLKVSLLAGGFERGMPYSLSPTFCTCIQGSQAQLKSTRNDVSDRFT